MGQQEENRARSENKDREARILDSAGAMLLRYGYEKVTIGDIAEEAGISKGAIYLHFASRDALFQALVMREITRFSITWMQKVEDDPLGGTLSGLYRNTLITLADFPLIRAMIGGDRKMMGDLGRYFGASMYVTAYHTRQSFIRRMQAVGAIRSDYDPSVLAYIFNALSHGLIKIVEVMPEGYTPHIEDLIQNLTRLLDSALSPPNGEQYSEVGKQVYREVMAEYLDRLNRSTTGDG
jgi:TetR/AcrR family acrAB operon transcriptional repressor